MVGHRLARDRPRKLSWHRDARAGLELTQLAPALEREERMVGGSVDTAAEARAEAVHALDAAAEPGAHRGDAELQVRPDGGDLHRLAPLDRRDDLVHAAARARRRVVDERGAGQALAHAWARGEDDQVAGLEAAGDAVEVLEARGRARDRRAVRRELLELVQLGGEQVVDRAEVLATVVVGDLEDRALGEVDELARRRLVGVHARLDLVGGAQEAAEHRVLADDARVLADVADGGDRAGQQVDRGAAADVLEQAGLLEVLDERERVDRLADRVQVEHRLEDQAVRLAVEVLRLEALVDDQRGQRGVRQQDRAEDRLLGLEVLRRGCCRVAVALVCDRHVGGRV